MRVDALGALIIALAGCNTAPPPPPPVAAPAPPPATAAPPTSAPAAQPSLEQVLCRGRTPCRIDVEKPAGRDREGRPLSVVKVAYTELPPEQRQKARGKEAMIREEFWLVTGDGGRPQLLADYWDDYGNRDTGHTGNIRDNQFELVSYSRPWNGASKRERYVTCSLSPLRITRVLEHLQTGERNEGRWVDLTTLQGEGYWGAPRCGGELAGAAFTIIPRVALPPEFLASAWKTASLAGCASHIDGREPRFTRHSPLPKEPATGASMSLVASGRTLILEIVDEKLVSPGDQIEVWLATGVASMNGWLGCVDEAKDAAPKQWIIDAASGHVRAGAGKPAVADLVVESANGPAPRNGVSRRFKIELPKGYDRIALVYDDVNAPGGAPVPLATTRQLRPGIAASFGRLEATDDVQCVLGPDGALTTVSPPPEPDRAFLPAN